MAYFAPFIDQTGFHMPSFADIRDYLVEQYRSIYGQDVYLGNDSLDYQEISVRALMIFDAFNAGQLAYDNRSPQTAIGTALDSVIKYNGMSRKAASFSTVQMTCTGLSGTVIINGMVGDVNGNKWDLPPVVTLDPVSGITNITALCQVEGSITALPGDISTILTPTAGWVSTINNAAANMGLPVEQDSAIRSRQAISTELPSQTLLAGTIAALITLPNVTRQKVYENPTNIVDVNGLPPHSITAIVEGGSDNDIAKVIYNNKGPGCFTNGDHQVIVSDPIYGISSVIRFYRPTYIPIFVTVHILPLSGFTSAVAAQIAKAVNDYLNSLEIGEELTISALYGAALSVMINLSQPVFSIRELIAGTSIGTQGTDDIIMTFNQVAQGVTYGDDIPVNIAVYLVTS